MIILQALLMWMLIGSCIWFFKTFIYFRGPSHCVTWLVLLHEKKNGPDPRLDLIKANPLPLVIIGLITYCIFGPISIFDFISVIKSVNSYDAKK